MFKAMFLSMLLFFGAAGLLPDTTQAAVLPELASLVSEAWRNTLARVRGTPFSRAIAQNSSKVRMYVHE